MISAPRFWYQQSILATCLQPVAWLFQLIVTIRRYLYRSGFLKQRRAPVPVIIVGNIVVGGTGKTPFVAWLTMELLKAGFRPGIVSRGYGGRLNRRPMIVDRSSSAEHHLLQHADVDVVIADDGLQHYRLARDMEIAVLDGERLLGNGRLMPAGPLREPAARLQEVDAIFVNGRARYPGACNFELAPGNVVALDTGETRELQDFDGSRVWSVAGIGNPDRFHGMLASVGIDPVKVAVPDHGTVSLERLREKIPDPILMTEKDAVKYLSDTTADTWYVSVVVDVPREAEEALMKEILELLRNGGRDG